MASIWCIFQLQFCPGITDEDYDLFYEIWQEFDPDGTQYIDYKALSEFLDVLEDPLQVYIHSSDDVGGKSHDLYRTWTEYFLDFTTK